MADLLKKAFKEASTLPEVEQNTLAKWVLEELEAKRKWEKISAGSENIPVAVSGNATGKYRNR
jgi:hypothetical protein